jgi:cysteine synthase A
MARELGHPVVVYMPELVTPERRAIVERFGGEVRLTPRSGGYEEALRRRDVHRGLQGCFVPDQFGNPDNPRCHDETTGAEILEQLAEQGVEAVDDFVAGVGTGGTLMGVGAALRRVMPRVRIVAVEPSESAVMAGGGPGEHGIHGIGDGFIPPLVDMERVDQVATVATEEAHAEADRIHETHGYCVGMSSGANMLAARRLAASGRVVLTIWPDCADRYGTMGLEGPAAAEGACPLRSACAQRSEERLPR